uniref:Uncharacterized protein n=1 Tax=Cryptomonas curvata TaxID=233186 RepID=A0A6T8AGT7_9CRYP|mmetsp:Transcript_45180/g.94632  ORF Transcript_45180/g.94632 Transcript_45180/m.94632 type:complete len:110 (+) Transcript_45180:215-544(+)
MLLPIAVNVLSSSIRDGGPDTAFCGTREIAFLSSTGLMGFYPCCLFALCNESGHVKRCRRVLNHRNYAMQWNERAEAFLERFAMLDESGQLPVHSRIDGFFVLVAILTV